MSRYRCRKCGRGVESPPVVLSSTIRVAGGGILPECLCPWCAAPSGTGTPPSFGDAGGVPAGGGDL